MARTPRLDVLPRPVRALAGAAAGLLVALVLLALRGTDTVEGLELQLVDLRTRTFMGRREPDPRIVICQVMDEDEAAVNEAWTTPWPWPLTYNALAFRVLADAGVAVAVVDVYQLDQGAGQDDWPRDRPLEEWERLSRDQQALDAEEYRAALRKVEEVALAFELHVEPAYEVEARAKAAREGERLGRLSPTGPRGVARAGANLPVRRVIEGAKLLGFANVLGDVDGVVRRAPMVGRWGDAPVLSLCLAAASLVTGEDPVIDDDNVLHLGEIAQPLMADGTFLMNFRGPSRETYPRVPPHHLLQWAYVLYMKAAEEHLAAPEDASDEAKMEAARAALAYERAEVLTKAREKLADKIVIWGVNLTGRQDIVTSPVSGTFQGPEFQATMLDNLLHGDGRVRASETLNLLILLGLTIGLGALGSYGRGRFAHHGLPVLLGVLLVFFAFWRSRCCISFDLFTPLLGIFLTWGGNATLRVFTEGRRNRWLQGTFERYLAPSIIKSLKENPGLLALGGRRRELTILFSDVEGFTELTEKLDEHEVVELLNRYLTLHSAPIMSVGGVVDKFEGDAVMAFFGDPVATDDHALQACRAALQVMADLPKLRPTWEGFGLKGFRIRIGINSGTVVVGNMGSDERFDYTCLGDPVNIASRLEGANRPFGSGILIGPLTYEHVADSVVARPIADLMLVGKAEPVRAYELLAMRDSAPPDLVEHVRAFTEAHEALREGDLDTARRAISEAERLRPGDEPTAWLGRLADRLESGALPMPWTGLVVMDRK